MTKKKTEYYTLFEVRTVPNGRVLRIERTENWEVNITKTSKSFGRKWKNQWLQHHQKTVEVYEILEGRKLVRRTNDDGGHPQTFLNLVFALRVISKYNSTVSYHIFKLAAQELRLNSSNVRAKLESLKQKLELDRVVDKLPWTNFNAPFAFYYFVIDNVVKCGAVGLKGQKNSEYLNSRLAGHRSTHARFKLINIIYFKDSKTITVFEKWIKFVLEDYSIGTSTSIEQYEWPGENSEEIANEIILKEFDGMNRLNGGAGWLCSPEFINDYNERTRIKTKPKID